MSDPNLQPSSAQPEIPEDLKAEYERNKYIAYEGFPNNSAGHINCLIERIAALTAKRDQARADLESLRKLVRECPWPPFAAGIGPCGETTKCQGCGEDEWDNPEFAHKPGCPVSALESARERSKEESK